MFNAHELYRSDGKVEYKRTAANGRITFLGIFLIRLSRKTTTKQPVTEPAQQEHHRKAQYKKKISPTQEHLVRTLLFGNILTYIFQLLDRDIGTPFRYFSIFQNIIIFAKQSLPFNFTVR